jgi:DNA (cytosine-5)-methyltransferase 1
MTAFSRLSRFGMTYKPLTDISGEELSMSSVVAFHVRTLVQQEKEPELVESVAGCGEKWHASFAKYDPDLSLWKTHQCSLLGDLDEFSETWPQWGLMRGGECWEQRTLEQTIRGTGFGLSPDNVSAFHTPNTTGLDGGSNSRKALRARMEKLPTPQATDHRSKPTSASWKAKGGMNYSLSNPEIQQKWPTPLSTEYRANRVKRENHHNGLTQAVLATQDGGKLNQTWVEWLMGWPLGWTDLKPLEMDKSPCVQQPHGKC